MQSFTSRCIEIIQEIPSGSITTYGIIATAAGNPSGARQVARILHSCSQKYQLPWHRVVNRLGEIPKRNSMSHLSQMRLLQKEGVVIDSTGKIDLDSYLWLP